MPTDDALWYDRRFMTEVRTSFLPGETFADKYRVECVLGGGGMGVVVAARHLQLDERVAIKFMRPDISANDAGAERFLREARATAKVKSEHIVRVFDVGTQDGILYMVMEHLEGQDLARMVASEGPIACATAVEYVLQACEAIAEAHSRGIVHRDLKPENLFLTHRANGSPCVKVLDFGISKFDSTREGHRMTSTSALMGSPIYMSPEQLASPRDVDARTDVWSLGVVLFELVSGAQPFTAESLPQLCIKVRETTAPLLRSVCPHAPAALEALVARCLEKNPALRFENIGQLAAALAPLAPPDARSAAARVIGASGGRATAVPLVDPPLLLRGQAPSDSRAVSGQRTELTWHGETKTATRRRFRLPLVAGFGILTVVGLALGAYSLTRRPPPDPVPVAPAALGDTSQDIPPATPPLPASLPPAISADVEASAAKTPEIPVARETTRKREVTGAARRTPVARTAAPSAPPALPPPPDDR
jgi:serine/threonine-protein kinase